MMLPLPTWCSLLHMVLLLSGSMLFSWCGYSPLGSMLPLLNASSVFPPVLCFAAFPRLVFSHRPGAPFPRLGILSWAQYFLVSMLSPRLLEDTRLQGSVLSLPGSVLLPRYSALRFILCLAQRCSLCSPLPGPYGAGRAQRRGRRSRARPKYSFFPLGELPGRGVDLPCSLTEAIVLEPVSTSCLECACLSSPRLFRKAHLTLHGLHPSTKA